MELPPFFTDPDADGRHAFTFSNGSEPDYDCDVSFGLEALDGKCRSISEPCGPFTRATAENTTSADAPGHAMNSNQFENKCPPFSTDLDTDDVHVAGPESSNKQSQQQEQVDSATGRSQSHAPTPAKWQVWDFSPVLPAGAPMTRSRTRPATNGRHLFRTVVQPQHAASKSGTVPCGSATGGGRLGVQPPRAAAASRSEPLCAAAQLGSDPQCTTSARFRSEPPGSVSGSQPPATVLGSPPSPVSGSKSRAFVRTTVKYGRYVGTPPSPPLHARGTIGGGGHVSDPVGDLCRLSTATNLSIGIDSSSSSNSNSSGKEHQKQTSPRLAVDIIQAIREKLGGGRCGGPVADFGAEDIQERRMTYKPPRVEGRRRKPASVEVEERATYRPPRMTLDVRDVVLKL
mmetsp:Transcript_124209/g.397552  ORF Transcript_124209/g.397552 Transcript_124209/m.397552 type:complete len:401 (-) Transcript_124209:535-1737(-)